MIAIATLFHRRCKDLHRHRGLHLKRMHVSVLNCLNGTYEYMYANICISSGVLMLFLNMSV